MCHPAHRSSTGHTRSAPSPAYVLVAAVLLTACAGLPPPVVTPAATGANPGAVPDATALPAKLTYWDCAASAQDCPDDAEHWLGRLAAPPGFEVRRLGRAPQEWAPTALTYGPDGRLYAAMVPRPFEEGFAGAIFTLSDTGTWLPFSEGWWLPTGLAFDPEGERLYVSSRGGRFEGRVSAVEPDGRVTEIATGLPCCYSAAEHQPNGLAFGPDRWLYVAIGARSDHGEPAWGETEPDLHPLEAGILRLRPDGQDVERYAGGLRNPYDVAFDLFEQLWAGDNGPDFGPPDRLHRIEAGGHYGFPFYDGCEACPRAPEGLEITPPYVEFSPHATPTGLVAYTGTQFPLNYLNSVFVALWNPGPGGRLVRVYGDRQVDDFLTGLWGPVDVVLAPDGSLVVADNLSGYLFRISWTGE